MSKIKLTWATYLTVLRIVIAIFMLGVLCLDQWWESLLLPLFLLGSLTDWLDGYFARTFAQQSKLGQFLDPVADKILYIASVLVLTYLLLDPWFTLLSFLIIIREFIIGALREFISVSNDHSHLSVSKLAKYKTAVQFFSSVYFFIFVSFNGYFSVVYGYIILICAVFLSYASAWGYLKKTHNLLTNIRQTQ